MKNKKKKIAFVNKIPKSFFVNNEEVGLKDDVGKLRMDLITPEIIIGMAEVLTYGANKYKPNSWQGCNPDLHYAACQRHLVKWKQGEFDDSETGLSHLKHAATNIMFLLYHEENKLRSSHNINCENIKQRNKNGNKTK